MNENNDAKGLRVVFAGTPEFASVALEALIHSPHQVVGVYTQPDRPAGRGLKLKPSSVKECANQYQIPVYQPKTLALEEDTLEALKPDVIVVSAYGALLPSPFLRYPRLGCVNIHPSLLPRWRGAAPIQRSIYAGDKVTGVSIMLMDAGLDTGPVLLQRQYVLDHKDTSQTLHDELAKLGAAALLEALKGLSAGTLKSHPQEEELVTYAHKITKEEALLDWMQTAQQLEHQVRAFNPWPVAYTTWQGQNLRIWFAQCIAKHCDAEPRTILHASPSGIDVATGEGVLRLLQLQLPGGKVLSSTDFYNAHHQKIVVGQHLI